MKQSERDIASAQQAREREEEELRAAVRRQHRAGLSDWAMHKVLHVHLRRVRKVRQELGLPPNRGVLS